MSDPVKYFDSGAPAGDASVPESPCVSVCALDEQDICMGCYRSAAEITDWFMATPAEKREIMRRVDERRRADGGIQLL